MRREVQELVEEGGRRWRARRARSRVARNQRLLNTSAGKSTLGASLTTPEPGENTDVSFWGPDSKGHLRVW
jgi:hypothetical protein